MGDEIRYPGFRHGKCYMSGLDGRAIELGRPKELKFEINKNDNAFTEVKGIAIWEPPILPNRIYEEMADWFEKSLTESAFALPKNYIINDGATILFWKDGTKTVVKRSKNEKFDKRLGFLTAYFQKHCGMSKTKANKFLDNLVVEDVKKKEQ